MKKDYQEIIKERLEEKRYRHSLGTAKAAEQLAERYGADPERALLAGLLHDYAKNMGRKELLKIAEKADLITDVSERLEPGLLHGPVGAYLVERELGVVDTEVLDAIRYHTTGRAGMGLLERIIYVADLVEEGRTFPDVAKMREKSDMSLEKGLKYALGRTIEEMIKKKKAVHPLSIAAWNGLLYEKKEAKKD